MPKFTRIHGFHLIEVLITLALTTIMSAWMINHYQQTMTEAHRRNAALTLIKLAAAIEDYALQHQSYSGVTLRKLHFNTIVNDYDLQIISADTQTFWIAANPTGRQAKNDRRCGNMLLSASGEKRISGRAKLNECWQF